MIAEVAVTVLGVATALVTAFVSRNSKSSRIRLLFWVSLLATVIIILWSGVLNIQSGKRTSEQISRLDPVNHNIRAASFKVSLTCGPNSFEPRAVFDPKLDAGIGFFKKGSPLFKIRHRTGRAYRTGGAFIEFRVIGVTS